MEVDARELIPALRDAAPGVRFTAFVNREAAGRGPRRRVASSCRCDARSRVEWVRGEQQLLPGPRAPRGLRPRALARARPRRRAAASRRVTTIHDLNYLLVPEAHFGAARRSGMRVLVPLAARRSHRVIADSRVDARRPRRSACACPRGKIDVVPLGARPAGDGRADAGGRAARAARRSATGRCCSRCRPSARTRTCAGCSTRSRGSPPSAGRCSCCPATRRRTRPSCASTPRRSASPATCASLGWTSDADLEGLFALAARVRVPVALRGLRAAGARGDGARRAGRVLGPRVAARGRGRRGAAVRPRRPGGDRRGDRAAARRPRRRPSGCAPPGRAQAARFTWERDRRADARELRARARRARSSRRPRRASRRATAARALRANQAAVDARSAAPAVVHAHDRVGEVAGRGAGGDEAVDALLDELGRGVVGVAHDDARRADARPPRRRRARSPRGATAAPGRARARRSCSTSSAATKPGRLDDVLEPVRGDRGEHRGALGPVAEDARRAAPGTRSRARRDRGHDRRRALLRDVAAGEHDERLGGQRRGRRRAGRRTRPRSTVHRRRAGRSARRRSAVSRGEAERALAARAGTAPGPRQPTRPADAAEVLAPVRRASTARASRRRAGSGAARRAQRRRRAARSTGTTRCARRRSGGRGAAGATSTPAPKTSGGSDPALARRRGRAPCRGPAATTRTPGTSPRSPRGHWRSVR